eukprot:1008855_1
MAASETIEALLLSEGWSQSYVERALKSYEYIRHINCLLFDKYSKFHTTFLSLNEVNQLKITDSIDFRDPTSNGKFVFGTIIEKESQNGTKLKILYKRNRESRQSRTIWCDTNCIGAYQFAKPESISNRPATILPNIQRGGYIDLNPICVQEHRGWRVAQICDIDPYSGQIQVVYHDNDPCRFHFYWVHVDNALECKVLDGVKNGASEVSMRVMEMNRQLRNDIQRLTDDAQWLSKKWHTDVDVLRNQVKREKMK